jgi:hypothetical protein
VVHTKLCPSFAVSVLDVLEEQSHHVAIAPRWLDGLSMLDLAAEWEHRPAEWEGQQKDVIPAE